MKRAYQPKRIVFHRHRPFCGYAHIYGNSSKGIALYCYGMPEVKKTPNGWLMKHDINDEWIKATKKRVNERLGFN